MKNILAFVLLISTISQAQHTVKGSMSPKLESDWVILYKLEGTKQVFVNNTTIKTDSIIVNGKKQVVGSFEIKLPATAKPGSYRATYRLEEAGFVDFFYNKENVSFIFNPNYPQEAIAFQESTENKLYTAYMKDVSMAQQRLDSIQVAVLQDPTLDLKAYYLKVYKEVDSVQNTYVQKTKNKYIAPFVKASARINPPEILSSVNEYLSNIKNTFFNTLDFSNKALMNSSFLSNRILDYVFYINFSDDEEQQQILYKKSIETILSKIQNVSYKRDIIQFLIENFEISKNLEIIDYLFENHYNKLPENLQNKQFIAEKLALFSAEIGRVAPDFSWNENGKTLKLSALNDAENYVLVFWSTSCSHCLREIPELHSYMKNKTAMKVIGFALENDASVWSNYKNEKLLGWHNVLGLKKWKNETARTYQINSTPTYFILDKNKKIISKPTEFKDLVAFIDTM
ncbi:MULTISPECIES: TlpA family protein disulfide reductase [unclassified Polaribacter]|uniref:TlpA family protein disulfide reductase n=1 Tax=unclassified Polaribacter TaxID=196858 RepID=UPI001CB8E03F|nr:MULTISPECIES: TlpA disulfide reductase family protein [unclassified Polaribacter]